MQEEKVNGTVTAVYAQWPRFALLYGGMVVTLLFMGVSLDRGWLSFVPLATAVLLILAYFFLASLWVVYQLYDRRGLRPSHILFDMGQLLPESRLVYVDVGRRYRPILLSRRLTIGHITIVDIFNPQWMAAGVLGRWRQQLLHPQPDPRLSWREGQFDLLPLPDDSAPAIMLCQVTSPIWQHGDRLALLQEAYRVLQPDGRLLFAEQSRTQTTWLTAGPAAAQLPTAAYWRSLLVEAGFHIQREQNPNGLITLIRAQKPGPTQVRQLAFDLKF
ncbi:MAG: methyltransferase domain-containing protein [Anaerolineae bacterium]|nr:methyltransferase domain-containing protein [Anaerolineae bacterium]